MVDRKSVESALLELTLAPPAVSRAAQYARIVHDAATLRPVIGVAASIAERAYDSPVDVAAAVGDARDQVDKLHREVGAAGWQIFRDMATLDDSFEAPSATLLQRTDGRGLFYEGRENGLQGDPGSGKTWVAQMAAAEVLKVGGTVVYIDFEDTWRAGVARLHTVARSCDCR